MRPRIAWTIFRKELVETLRDRRTLFMMVVLPILLYPMMIIAVSWFQKSQAETQEQRASMVALWGEAPPGLARALEGATRVTLKPWEAVPGSVREALASGSLRVPGDGSRPPDGGGRGEVGD